MSNEVFVATRLDTEQAAQLAQVAKRTERSLAQTIRLAIREYLEREGEKS